MKRLDVLKTIQLIVFIALAAVCVYTVLRDNELYRAIATINSVGTLSALLWAVLGVSFIFLFIDFTFFSTFKQNYRELDFVAHSDPLSGIANRVSCDALIEKYQKTSLPDNVGCIMFDLTNIKETNTLYGHSHGNELIKNFSNILRIASVDLCFIGRNGGNKFIALFEEGTDEKISTFLKRVHSKIDSYNSGSETRPISYKYGIAFQEEKGVANTITELIALANSRINNE